MTSSINKPAHKKNVVLANSPLPIEVRPYIDQMNVNQNFKNQIWAAQVGTSPRKELEMELDNMDFSIEMKFGDAFISAVNDTIPEKCDTIINYVLQKGTLTERITASPFVIHKERYSDAQFNLNEISYLSNGKQQIVDFIDLQHLQIQIAQMPDSLRKQLLSQNESFISSIAGDSSHFCQGDALGLLETLNDTIYPRTVYLGDITEERIIKFTPEYDNHDSPCGLLIKPNPAHRVVTIGISEQFDSGERQIVFVNQEGKILKVINIENGKEEYTVNLSDRFKGINYIILYDNGNIQCVKKLVVE